MAGFSVNSVAVMVKCIIDNYNQNRLRLYTQWKHEILKKIYKYRLHETKNS